MIQRPLFQFLRAKIMKNIFFYIAFAIFTTHELDAMSKHEWRVLPLTSWLSDEYGFIVFLLFHVPLFAILVGLISSLNRKIRTRSRLVISIFLIVHGILHLLFIGHDKYEFTTVYSNILIFGGALCGLIYILFEYTDNKKSIT